MRWIRSRHRHAIYDLGIVSTIEKVEIIWTVIPFLIVVFLFVLTLRGMNRADPPPAPSRLP